MRLALMGQHWRVGEAPIDGLTTTSTTPGEVIMSWTVSEQANDVEEQAVVASANLSNTAKSGLTLSAAWIDYHDIPFLVSSIGMIFMLLWAGAYKMTAPGAEGIVPPVTHSPLINWHFKLFGPYIGSDLIGATEVVAALLILAGYLKPKAGILGGFITTVMFFTTSTMVITTPGSTTLVHGIRYMSFIGLFLFKDFISLGVSFYLITYFGRKAILAENKCS